MNEEQNINQLPKEWKWVKLGEACEIVSGNTPKGLELISNKGEYQFYKVSDMNLVGNEIRMNVSNLKLTIEEIKKLKVKVYPKGTVIFPKRGGAILTNKKRVLSQDASFDLNVMGILPNDRLLSNYLFYWIQKLDLSKIYDGSNVPQINNKNVAPLDFPLPPRPTQQAVVSKIEELFSELDKGIENLYTAQQQLNTYRQSVLKWAFEGKLTNEIVKEGELPKGWKWVLINEIGRIKGGKRLPPKHQYSEEPTDFVYIMAGNLKDGTVRNKSTFIREETYNALANYKVSGGEVYITIVGACIGDAGIIPENIGKSILTENAAKIIELRETYNKYLALWINSTICQANIKSKILSATLGKLALNRIGTLEVPIAPIIEQHDIVQEIESRISVADKMEESITQSLQQAEALRQSILKMAFEGKLL